MALFLAINSMSSATRSTRSTLSSFGSLSTRLRLLSCRYTGLFSEWIRSFVCLGWSWRAIQCFHFLWHFLSSSGDVGILTILTPTVCYSPESGIHMVTNHIRSDACQGVTQQHVVNEIVTWGVLNVVGDLASKTRNILVTTYSWLILSQSWFYQCGW